MSEQSPGRLEPVLDTGPIPLVETLPERRLEAARPVAPPMEQPVIAPVGPAEQLARIEDKSARIEEKFARQEATSQRVLDRFELASQRMSEVALQSDLAAVRGEVTAIARRLRGVPGYSALVMTSVVTSLLTAALVIAIMKYVPGLLAR